MPKPSDVFLGVIEFFAVLLPGALITWTVWRWPWPWPAETSGPLALMAGVINPFLPKDAAPTARWVAFALVSWGVGQVLYATASPLDWAWDWLRNRKRLKDTDMTIRSSADKAMLALRSALLGLIIPETEALDKLRDRVGAQFKSREFWFNVVAVALIILLAAWVLHLFRSDLDDRVRLALKATVAASTIIVLVSWWCFEGMSKQAVWLAIVLGVVLGALVFLFVVHVIPLGLPWMIVIGSVIASIVLVSLRCSKRVREQVASLAFMLGVVLVTPVVLFAARVIFSCLTRMIVIDSVITSIALVGSLLSILSYSKDFRARDILAAERNAVQEYGEWAWHYLRQMNVTPFTMLQALSGLRRIAEGIEIAALMAKERIGEPSPGRLAPTALDSIKKTATQARAVVTSIDAVHKHISQAVLLVVQSPQAAAQRQEEAKDALRSAVGTLREKLDEAVQQAAQQTTQASTQPQPQKDAAAEQQTAVVTVQTAAAALEVAHTLAQFEMADAERQKPRPSRDVINNYNFACAVLRARAPAAFAEVEKLQAQSKFFRSLATGILLVGDAFLLALAVRPGSVGQTPQPPMWNGIVLPTGVPWWVACIGWAVSLITSLVLYNNMRQKAVDEAYQSAVVAFALGAKPEVPGAGVAKSAAQA